MARAAAPALRNCIQELATAVEGNTTGLATILADELDADWATIRTAFAPADATLYNNTTVTVSSAPMRTKALGCGLPAERSGAPAASAFMPAIHDAARSLA
jgi:isoquinoline 1-oxidoreductase beta subunit